MAQSPKGTVVYFVDTRPKDILGLCAIKPLKPLEMDLHG